MVTGLLRFAPVAQLHHRLFSAAYRLHEAEVDFVARLPEIMRQHSGGEPEIALGIDVGAGLGPFSLHMIKYCHKVVAVEPNHAQAAYLRRVFGRRLTVAEVAVSDRPGRLVLVDDSKGGQWRRPLARLRESTDQAAWSQACDVETLDGLLERLNLSGIAGGFVAKIDVEGHELAVLKGMRRLLERRPAILIVEIETRFNPKASAVFELLDDAGFECFVYKRGGLRTASYAEAEAMQQKIPTRFGRLRGYQSNFVFVRQVIPVRAAS